MVTSLAALTEDFGVPRAAYFPHKLGAPIGKQGDPESQRKDLLACLELVGSLSCGQVAAPHV